MIKLYRIIILLIVLTFLTTYNPNRLSTLQKKNYHFFKIQNVKVVNNILIKESEIIKKLIQIKGKNIFFINKEDIEGPLKLINFLEKIEVKKKYPNTIIIKIYETKPTAILFKKKEKFIIDNLSNLFPLNENMSEDNLPNVFGQDAEIDFMNFFNLLKKNNFPKNIIKNFYYFQIGRWDIKLVNNQIIKFPKNKINNAIQQSIKLLDRKDFKNYNIIDLRIYGKIIVEK